jgi:hypothetical protein
VRRFTKQSASVATKSLEFGSRVASALRRQRVISRRAASEFPNDNPELHDGIVWSCPEPCARPLPTLRLRATEGALPKVLGPAWDAPGETPAASENDGAPEVARAAPKPSVHKVEPSVRIAPAAPEGPFERFVATVARVALNRGATRAAAAVTALLSSGRLARDGIDPALLDELGRRRILGAASQVTPEFAAATSAWRAVLEGTGGDLSGCGSGTLDGWAAELLAAVMNAPRGDAGELKRELRRSGVAAFGLLAVA